MLTRFTLLTTISSLFARHVHLQRFQRTSQRPSRLPFEFLIGFVLSKTCTPTHILTRFSSRFAPIYFQKTIELPATPMPEPFLNAAAKKATSTTMSCESYDKLSRKKTISVSLAIAAISLHQACLLRGRAILEYTI